MIPITYAVTVCNELAEITNLLNFLQPRIRNQDEILVQYDSQSVSHEVLNYLNIISQLHKSQIKIISYPLNADFGSFKNNLKRHANGIFIVQFDADEMPSEYLLMSMPNIIELNKEVDLFFVPRINTVDGITESHIMEWGWSISKMKSQINEKEMNVEGGEYSFLKKIGYVISETDNESKNTKKVKYYKPINSFPDYQTRIYRRTSEIEWSGKVHERIVGYNTLSVLPQEEIYCIYHHKNIIRQEKQNQLYTTL
jgi:hypothetical protein